MATLRNSCGTLKNYWYVAALSNQLGNRAPIGRVLLGEMVALYRDFAGKPVALTDRCLHRNALLSRGEVEDGYLRCPYHGWIYNAQGRCIHIPAEGPDYFVRPDMALETFPTLEQDGLIWIYMGDPAVVRTAPFPIPHLGEKGWQAIYLVTTFPNNVTNLVENFMDVPHTLFLHGAASRSLRLLKGTARVKRTEDSVIVAYQFPTGHINWIRYVFMMGSLPESHTDTFHLPGVTCLEYDFGYGRRLILSSLCTPVSPQETVVTTVVTSRFGRLSSPLLAPIFRRFFRRMLNQDLAIMRDQGKGMLYFGRNRFVSTQADIVHDYIESLFEHAARDSPGDPPPPCEAEITLWI